MNTLAFHSRIVMIDKISTYYGYVHDNGISRKIKTLYILFQLCL